MALKKPRGTLVATFFISSCSSEVYVPEFVFYCEVLRCFESASTKCAAEPKTRWLRELPLAGKELLCV
jgi:hypothetical protein